MAAGEEFRKLVCACGKPLGTFAGEGLELGQNPYPHDPSPHPHAEDLRP